MCIPYNLKIIKDYWNKGDQTLERRSIGYRSEDLILLRSSALQIDLYIQHILLQNLSRFLFRNRQAYPKIDMK